MVKQSYCPGKKKLNSNIQKTDYFIIDEPFAMHLKLLLGQTDSKITSLSYKFRKHHEGKMLVQRGTAFREHIRIVLQGSIPVTGSDHKVDQDVTFDVPTRLVSPSFISHHTRVHYDLQFQVVLEHGGLFKSTHLIEFGIPITIANLPYDQLLRIPSLTAIEYYKTSKACPEFFDPTLEEPPEAEWVNTLQSTCPANLLTSTPRDEPPNYFSIPTIPPQLEIRSERKERTVYLSRTARTTDLMEATVITGLFDETW